MATIMNWREYQRQSGVSIERFDAEEEDLMQRIHSGAYDDDACPLDEPDTYDGCRFCGSWVIRSLGSSSGWSHHLNENRPACPRPYDPVPGWTHVWGLPRWPLRAHTTAEV